MFNASLRSHELTVGKALCSSQDSYSFDNVSDFYKHKKRHALQRVSQELDYRIDICRVTQGAHIEHL
jgi:hypothetical protein